MFEATVDGFGRPLEVRGCRSGPGVTGSVFECPVQCDERGQAVRYARGGHCVDLRLHQGLVCPLGLGLCC